MKLRANASLVAVAKATAKSAKSHLRTYCELSQYAEQTTGFSDRAALRAKANTEFGHYLQLKEIAEHLYRLAKQPVPEI